LVFFLTNPISGYFAVLGIFLCSTYSIWLFNRIMYGTLSESITNFKDVDSLDLFVISFLTIFFLLLGLFPNYITNFCYFDVLYLFEFVKFKN